MAGAVGEDSAQHLTVLVAHLLRHMQQYRVVYFLNVDPGHRNAERESLNAIRSSMFVKKKKKKEAKLEDILLQNAIFKLYLLRYGAPVFLLASCSQESAIT